MITGIVILYFIISMAVSMFISYIESIKRYGCFNFPELSEYAMYFIWWPLYLIFWIPYNVLYILFKECSK